MRLFAAITLGGVSEKSTRRPSNHNQDSRWTIVTLLLNRDSFHAGSTHDSDSWSQCKHQTPWLTDWTRRSFVEHSWIPSHRRIAPSHLDSFGERYSYSIGSDSGIADPPVARSPLDGSTNSSFLDKRTRVPMTSVRNLDSSLKRENPHPHSLVIRETGAIHTSVVSHVDRHVVNCQLNMHNCSPLAVQVPAQQMKVTLNERHRYF